MSDVVNEASQEFWRSPIAVVASEPLSLGSSTAPVMAEVCPRCRTEFLLGSHFCHTCGTTRPLAQTGKVPSDAEEISKGWHRTLQQVRFVAERCYEALRTIEFPGWLRYLHFHEIKKWVGLPTASLIAFVVGMSCVTGALLVGLLTAKTYVDWQAIQFYRAEWLLAATAAFVAGILLKRHSKSDGE